MLLTVLLAVLQLVPAPATTCNDRWNQPCADSDLLLLSLLPSQAKTHEYGDCYLQASALPLDKIKGADALVTGARGRMQAAHSTLSLARMPACLLLPPSLTHARVSSTLH